MRSSLPTMQDVIDSAARDRRIDLYRRLQEVAVIHRDASLKMRDEIAADTAERLAVVLEAAGAALLRGDAINTMALASIVPVYQCACEVLDVGRREAFLIAARPIATTVSR